MVVHLAGEADFLAHEFGGDALLAVAAEEGVEQRLQRLGRDAHVADDALGVEGLGLADAPQGADIGGGAGEDYAVTRHFGANLRVVGEEAPQHFPIGRADIHAQGGRGAGCVEEGHGGRTQTQAGELGLATLKADGGEDDGIGDAGALGAGHRQIRGLALVQGAGLQLPHTGLENADGQERGKQGQGRFHSASPFFAAPSARTVS